ncbi:CAAX protease self-immunity [Pyrinomonas methylaliphatogenes]|uniref:CAAX protease self-immunity n=2 Tax=Pyrinomonas methylaliphatogenes TaxID=454194 RepID=A0A0B6WVP5_9BACT|nr:CAAX protease self-immunity [Pyrinomonas methylaliphatogenes]
MTMKVRRLRSWALALSPTLAYNFGLTLITALLARTSIAGTDPRTLTSVLLGCVLAVELGMLGGVLAWLRARGEGLGSLGWGKPTRPRALVVGLVIALVYSGFTLASPAFGSSALELSLFKVWGALVGVIGGAVEEIVFRGFVTEQLREVGLGPFGQVAGAAVLFGLIHGGLGLLMGKWFLLPGIILTTLLGLALGWIYLDGDRSLTGPVLSHALINLLIEPWLLLGFVNLSLRR